MGDYNRGFLYPYFLAASSHPPHPPINNAASRTNTNASYADSSLFFVCSIEREKEKKKNFKIHAYIPLPSINGGAIRVRSWRICWIAARMKYLDTNIYIYVCVKKDPRNNFPKSTFRIIENDRYSTISRWEIKRKKKIAARKKIFKIKIS